MRFAPATQVGDMTPGNPHRVPDAACALRQLLELGVHHPALLRAQDGGQQGLALG